MDNGPAQKENNSMQLRAAGDLVGDMFELSTIRREDYKFHTGWKYCLFDSELLI